MADKRVYKSACKQTIEAMRVYPLCPVTGGVHTRMTEDGFMRACLVHLTKANIPQKNGKASFLASTHAWCRICNGEQRPEELEIINLKDFDKKGDNMPPKLKRAKCAVCGKEDAMVSKNHGVLACSTCKGVQAKINSDPGSVMAEIKRIHGTEILQKHGGPGVAALEKANKALTAEVARLEKQVKLLSDENNEQHQLIKDFGGGSASPTVKGGAPSIDMLPLNRLVTDSDLLAAVNVLADNLRGAA